MDPQRDISYFSPSEYAQALSPKHVFLCPVSEVGALQQEVPRVLGVWPPPAAAGQTSPRPAEKSSTGGQLSLWMPQTPASRSQGAWVGVTLSPKDEGCHKAALSPCSSSTTQTRCISAPAPETRSYYPVKAGDRAGDGHGDSEPLSRAGSCSRPPRGHAEPDSAVDLLLTISWDLLPTALCITPCTQHLNTRSYSFYLSCLKAPV